MQPESRPRYHIDYLVRPEPHPPMYLMHKWWARKPHNIIAEYINAYSLPNDVVFDPFMGSGVVPIEAVHLGRRAIGLDYNPMACFIAKNTGMPSDIELLQTQFDELRRKCFSLRSILYDAICPQCHSKGEITHLIFNNSKNLDVIQEIWVQCKSCGVLVASMDENSDQFASLMTNQQFLPSQFEHLLKQFELEIPVIDFTYYEKVKFLQLRHELIKVPDGTLLFTHRALLMLSKIRKEILTIPNIEIRDLFLFAFSSALGQSSKMVWVIEKRKGKQVHKQVGSWTHHFFWNPHKYFEVNAWNCFEERVKKIIRGKKNTNSWFQSSNRKRYWKEVWENKTCHLEQSNDSIDAEHRIDSLPWKFANDVNEIFDSRSTIYLGNKTIQDLLVKNSGEFPPESVDLIVTDPPYGDSIQYYELSKLWNAWLGFSLSPEKEIVINSRQEKDLTRYQSALKQAFEQCYKILKPDRFLIVTFHNSSFEIRNILISAILNAGFELQHVLFQVPPRRSLKAYLHPKGTPIGDYYIRFYKAKWKTLTPLMSEERIIPTIRDILINILKNRGEPTPLLWLANLVDSGFAHAGLFPFPGKIKLEEVYSESKEFSIQNDNLRLQSFNGIAEPLTSRIYSSLKEFFAELPAPYTKIEKKNALWHSLQKFNGDLTPDPLIVRDLVEKIEKDRFNSQK